jgi:flavin reductase (DIM6/NTAB) family NADH-FMN oxidoreductase RutF
VLMDSLSVFECARHAVHDGGDHYILVGEVKRRRSSRGWIAALFPHRVPLRLGARRGDSRWHGLPETYPQVRDSGGKWAQRQPMAGRGKMIRLRAEP